MYLTRALVSEMVEEDLARKHNLLLHASFMIQLFGCTQRS
jgi:hypothetical protein